MSSEPQRATAARVAVITQCFGPDLGGIEVLMTSLADALAASGQAVEVFADHIRRPGAAELARSYPIRRFGGWRPIRRWAKRRALGAEGDPGFRGVFADSWKSVAAAPPGVGPIAVLAHGTEFPAAPSAHKARRIAAALSRARTVIASSQFTASRVVPYLTGASTEVVVINPPPPPLPEPSTAALAEIRKLVAGRRPVVATLARLEPRKGVDAVIAALPRLKARHPDLVYLVGGAGDDLERLRHLAAARGVADDVVFLGPVTDPQTKAALLTHCDVYAMPSRNVGNSVEGFGIAYVEAAWFGRPSLAGVAGGASDVVRNGETGLLCDGRDPEAVAQALERLLDDDAARVRMGAAAAELARARFSWAHALPRYLAALGL